MAEPEAATFSVPEEVADRIAGVLLALSDLAEGNYDVQVPADLSEDHPVGALMSSINQMTRALRDARAESQHSRRELEEKLALIEQQRAAMRELSTPIIEVWDRVLCLPVVGVVDTVRSTEMNNVLLTAVVEKSADYVIVDITGIDVMDTGTADHFVGMARSVELLGARCIITGINPRIAQTMAHMGVDLHGVECHRTLRNALKLHLPRIQRMRAEAQ